MAADTVFKGNKMDNRTTHADLSAASSLLRRYAHFEGELPTPPATPPATATPAGTNGGTGDEKKFSQADLDFHIAKRVKEATEAARKKALEELGSDDPATDAELLKTAKQRREADKTELERAQSAAAKETEKREAAEKALNEERQQRIVDRRDAKFKEALTTAKIKPDKLDDALLLLGVKHADALKTAIKDDGTIDEKALAKIAEDAKKSNGEWFGVGGIGTQSHSGGSLIQPGDKDRQDAARQTLNAIRSRL